MEISARTDIETLKIQLNEKKNKFDAAIQKGEIFEETKKVYLEMKELQKELDRLLQLLDSKQDAISYQQDMSNPSFAQA